MNKITIALYLSILVCGLQNQLYSMDLNIDLIHQTLEQDGEREVVTKKWLGCIPYVQETNLTKSSIDGTVKISSKTFNYLPVYYWKRRALYWATNALYAGVGLLAAYDVWLLYKIISRPK